MPPADLDELLDLALDAGRRAGAFLLQGQHHDRQHVGTKNSSTDMVSEMDTGAESIIVEAIAARRPGDAVLAEEGGAAHGSTGVRWVIDPLDGTTNYLYGHPRYSVSIGVEVDGEAVVGVVVDPGLDEVFWAAKGRGAFCNGASIAVSRLQDASTALVATGFSYDRATRGRQGRLTAELLPRLRDVRRHGVASLDLCWVAIGRLDAYFETDLKPWDVCAGSVIAGEAGGVVCALDGAAPRPASIFASGPGIAADLLAMIAAAEGAVGEERSAAQR